MKCKQAADIIKRIVLFQIVRLYHDYSYTSQYLSGKPSKWNIKLIEVSYIHIRIEYQLMLNWRKKMNWPWKFMEFWCNVDNVTLSDDDYNKNFSTFF